MDIVFLSLFTGIHIAFAILSFYIFRKNNTQKLYLFFSVFSFFSGIYFLLIAISRITDVNIHWAILSCAAIYYSVFPWFIYEFIDKKGNIYTWLFSLIFGLALLLFIFEIGNGRFNLWQIVAHIGLIGLMFITLFAFSVMKNTRQRGANEFLILSVIFIFLGLEEIVSNYSGKRFLSNNFLKILPLDLFPLLFTLAIGKRLSTDFYYKSKMEYEKVKNGLNEKKLQLKELEKQRLEDELNYKKRDLADFGIEMTRRREYVEQILVRLKEFKKVDNIESSDINSIIQYTKSQLYVGQNFNKFHENVEKVNHEFMSKLKENYPTLTSNDLHLASLLRLKLNTKEIATVKNITPESVKVLRYRLRKKFNLQTGSSLTEYLLSY